MKYGYPLIFLHIPKTGGVSLYLIAQKQYNKGEVYHLKNETGKPIPFTLSDFEKKKLKYIQGHFEFGFHKNFESESKYITILRDPIDRVMSNYYFILEKEDHFLRKELLEKKYSLKQYVESGIASNTENCMVRHLSGNLDAPHNSCTREMLEQAKQNLKNNFSIVGIQENFDEFLVLLMIRYNWRVPFYKKYNITKKREKADAIDNETLTVLTKYNQLDIELYEYGKKLFKESVIEEGENFSKTLKRFKFKNNVYQLISKIKNSVFPPKN